jgi:hypothetical protein
VHDNSWSPERIEKVISEYGKTLQRQKSAVISDIDSLPYPKDDIKTALKLAIGSLIVENPDAPALKLLMGGYYQLAFFRAIPAHEREHLKHKASNGTVQSNEVFARHVEAAESEKNELEKELQAFASVVLNGG